jgi:release factor glutamine methyltransferase
VTVGAAVQWAARLLAANKSATPRLDAEVLLGYLLSVERTQLYVRWDDPLDAGNVQRFEGLVARRMAREPVAYLIGKRAFYDLDLYVTSDVLIPRPETEHLLEAALAWGQRQDARPLRVVDVGTGSGALAVALARHLGHAHVWGVDVSSDALRVAARNVRRYDLERRVSLLCGDLLRPFGILLDLIVANLPYIIKGELDSLMPDVAAYEPRLALDGGADGLDLIRRLLPQVSERLAAPGALFLEIDHQQANGVAELVRRYLPEARITVLRDYAGLERVVCAERELLGDQ